MKKRLIYICSLCLIACACAQRNVIPVIDTVLECDKCSDFPIEAISLGQRRFKPDTIDYAHPTVNPKDPNEIIYMSNLMAKKQKLYKYNLITKAKALIYEGAFVFPPKWSSQDWILLNTGSEKLSKMKSNGDSLISFTMSPENYLVDWSLDGSQFLFYKEASNHYTYIARKDGVIQDSVKVRAEWAGSWQHPRGWLLTFWLNSVLIQDMVSKRTLKVIPIEDQSRINLLQAQWINEDSFIISSLSGIYVVNVLTEQVKKIKCACETWRYSSISYSPANRKIIAERNEFNLDSDGAYLVTSRIVRMNLDGGQEEAVNIPK
jgi:hypothetical protein